MSQIITFDSPSARAERVARCGRKFLLPAPTPYLSACLSARVAPERAPESTVRAREVPWMRLHDVLAGDELPDALGPQLPTPGGPPSLVPSSRAPCTRQEVEEPVHCKRASPFRDFADDTAGAVEAPGQI